jgi:hypothetical protein
MAQRNSKTVARSSKTLYREGGPHTLAGEGKGERRFWESQVCVADESGETLICDDPDLTLDAVLARLDR